MGKIFKPEKVDIKSSPDINETVIQQSIADDPSVLGLGDLVLKDKERLQPALADWIFCFRIGIPVEDMKLRCNSERLTKVTSLEQIEYWDIERKRYPQYEHCAVIIAEDITSRFFNVINLFNGFIPLIAIHMAAYKYGEEIGLVFTKVLDEMPLGLVEEDEETQEITNRDYWLKRGTEVTVRMADEILEIINNFKPGFSLKYNKFYIGIAKDGQANNFAICRPKKNYMRLELRIPKTDEIDDIIEKNGIEEMDYDAKWGRYRIRLNKGDVKKNIEWLKTLLVKAESS